MWLRYLVHVNETVNKEIKEAIFLKKEIEKTYLSTGRLEGWHVSKVKKAFSRFFVLSVVFSIYFLNSKNIKTLIYNTLILHICKNNKKVVF